MDHSSILLAYSAYPAILAALAPRIRFSLHNEFRDGEIRLYLHKEFRAAELGDDATENDNFQSGKQRLQGPKISRPSWGAMRQKMAIFKVRNSVCRVQIFPGAFISYSK